MHQHLPKQVFYSIFITVNLLAFSFGLKAQNSKAQFSATVSIGPSIPVGNFADKNIDSTETHGAANIGPAIQLSVNYRFLNSIFGFGILGSWQENNRDDQAFIKHILDGLPASGNYDWVADGKTWTIWKVLAGPTMSLPVSADKKTRFEAGLAAGILKTSMPGYYFLIHDNSMNNYTEMATATARKLPATFCYQLSAGISRSISKSFSVTGNINFSHAAIPDEYTYYIFVDYQTAVQKHVDAKVPVSTLNILFGLRYEF